MKNRKAVVLFSGGLDSTTALCWALKQGYQCRPLVFDYGQRHIRECQGAAKIAGLLGLKLYKIKLEFPWLDVSSLVNAKKRLPYVKTPEIVAAPNLPSTYVPGRNLVFASIGVSLADSIGAAAVVMGPNAIDYSGYPDCRPAFYRALEKAVRAGTRLGAQGKKIRLLTPLIRMSKKDIIRLAVKVRAPLKYTWSCYAGGARPCGRCDSCKLRAKGFKEAGLADPAVWRSSARNDHR